MARLPEELLRLILLQVDDDDSQVTTLFNVMLSSKELYHTARPIFYHTIRCNRMMSRFPFDKVLKAFLHNPETATYVRELQVADWETCEPEESTAESQLEESTAESLVAELDLVNISPALRTDLEAGIRAGNDNALLCMLLSMCRNLNVLIIEHDLPFGEQSLTELFMEEVMAEDSQFFRDSKRSMLSVLKSFTVGRIDTEMRTRLDKYFTFWKLPSLRTFDGSQMEFIECARGPLDGEMSELRSITLEESIFDHTGLEYIFKFCPQLRKIDLALGDNQHYHSLEIDSGKFGEILRNHGSRLERFAFTNDSFTEWDFSETTLGDLTKLTQLKSLHLAWETLFGFRSGSITDPFLLSPTYFVDILPTSIQEFSVNMTDNWPPDIAMLDAQLLELMTSARFEKLKLIQVWRSGVFTLDLPRRWVHSVDTPKVFEQGFSTSDENIVKLHRLEKT